MKSNHTLPDVILSRDNVDGKFRLTENEAVEVVCQPKYPKTKAFVAGKPIKVGIGRQGPYITYNEVYMNVVVPTGHSIFQLDSNALKNLVQGISVAVTALTNDNFQLSSIATSAPFVTPTKASGREKPSCVSPVFVSKVKEAFDPCHLLPPAVTATANGLAFATDLLDVILRARLLNHLATIVPDAYRQHYVWDFARDNMKQVAVAMIVMGHIVPFTELVRAIDNPEQSLLGNISHFVHLTPQLHDKLQGSYLMSTCEIGVFYSGQVAGRPFRDRFQEHSIMALGSAPSATQTTLSQNAQRSREGSSLYAHFPSRFAAYNPKALGYFEQVEFYSGLSFDMLNPCPSLHATDSSGIFVWEKPVLDNLKALSATTEDGSMQSTQLQFVAYLCELAYTLALGCGNKVPPATGFDWPLNLDLCVE
jgi:hypothetical protein